MKKSKEYKKMIRKYKKMIRKDAKDASTKPFDYDFGLQMFVDYLYFMREYYELGENVFALELDNYPTRLQILNMILAAYEDWQNCCERRVTRLRKQFFELLGEYIEFLWD